MTASDSSKPKKIEAFQHSVAFVALVALDVACRILPHPPNFTPLAASALFAGFFFRNLITAFLVPMVAMLISDRLIGGYEWQVMITVYASLAMPLLLRGMLRSRLSSIRVLVGALASSAVFFLATNFAVWCFGSWYENSIAGLMQCYVAALPFFKYTLSGDLLWSVALFGIYALATSSAKRDWLLGRITRRAVWHAT